MDVMRNAMEQSALDAKACSRAQSFRQSKKMLVCERSEDRG
jgi:hypothetical protein